IVTQLDMQFVVGDNSSSNTEFSESSRALNDNSNLLGSSSVKLNRQIRLKCTATLSRVINMRSRELYFGQKGRRRLDENHQENGNFLMNNSDQFQSKMWLVYACITFYFQ